MQIDKYVINLKSRIDRRRLMERELRKVGWSAQFLEAEKPDDAGGFISVGARGCFLSHLSILDMAANRPSRHVLIMEDDLKFSPEMKNHWRNCLMQLASVDWDILYAGHYENDLAAGLTEISHKVPVRCAHFILFNAKVLSAMTDGLHAMLLREPGDPQGGPMHVDGAYSFLRAKDPSIRAFAYSPSLGFQRSSRSDISPAFFDDLSFLRQALAAFRQIKDRLSG